MSNSSAANRLITDFQSGFNRKQNAGLTSQYNAFIPEKISGIWNYNDPETVFLLQKANLALGRLDASARKIPNIDVYIKMHLRTEANKSSRIEGTQTTIEEDMLPEQAIDPERRNDHVEVQNYIRAIHFGIEQITNPGGLPLCCRLLKEIHKILMSGVRGEQKTPGEFRRSQNWIGGSSIMDARYVPPPESELPELMTDFEAFMNCCDDYVPDLIKIALLHYQFETIHPFLDGNGRIGRLMIPLFLLHRGILSKPCFYISDYFERHRNQYYDSLQKCRAENDLLGWLKFFLNAAIYTAEIANKKFKDVEDYVYNQKLLIAGLHRKNTDNLFAILNAFYDQPVREACSLSESTGMTIQTVNRLVKVLIENGLLSETTGFDRNRAYCLKGYLEIFKTE